jgi:predicted MPP superfamily phosphohydrolase
LKALGAGALCALAPLAYGDAATGWIEVERQELTLPRWDADGFKVGFIADLHANSFRQMEHAKRAAELVMAEKPDVILIGGDFVNHGDPARLAHVGQSLEPLRDAKVPVLAVLGNHDYWAGYFEKTLAAIESAPLKLLRNEAADVQGVTIAGIDDALNSMDRPGFIEEGRHSRSLIALFHEPDFVDIVPAHVSLQLSGHSHGGQVCLPGGFALHTPLGARRYISGYYPEAPVPLYVTRGVGTTGPEMRTFCPPEVTILTLRGG